MKMRAEWSPAQYLKFEDHRTRPAADLLSRVPGADILSAVDIGCGPGNSTELLTTRFPEAHIVGMDSSGNMIEAARQRLPAAEFETGDIETWDPRTPQQLLFANAVLQWVPNHQRLFPRLMSFVADGGSLAVQMPDNLDEPTHVSMRQAASDARWQERLALADSERAAIETAATYYEILKPHCRRVDIWRTTYFHPLQGLEGIVEWFKSTGLLPYLSRLDRHEKESYLAVYRGLLAEHYAEAPDGTVLLPFPRLFIVATK
ncbi:trans-aconitate 2-methyltransferase [Rhizobium leguminosarum]|nr:trans-aconitate 2-methyltransferase [Rhizobium leguminosarum]NEJ47465.1 trans-aconitate 2-methyltransferase [Rhizobium leguminosarum]NEJ54414.1 trans-aconitate 2-methyltransferase [Rhizobium leguminosarum]NEJ82128.1 trans-aconitate 2-methyltransferase [Rhizobium leguminosarum]